MTLSIELTSMREIPDTSDLNEFFWVYQTNPDPWDRTQVAEWTPYSDQISVDIERAFRCGREEIFINEIYRIDLKHSVQQHIDDLNRQRPIRQRRRNRNSLRVYNTQSRSESWQRERLSFHLGLITTCSTTNDTNYHGLPFILDWLLTFTKGKMNVTFRSIFPVLLQGLEQEGQNESATTTREIVDILNKIKDENLKKRETIKMKNLQACCVKLYTKDCYIYRVVNTALREDDRTKLNTVGPYCYFLYNYIGRHLKDYLSIRHRLRQTLYPTECQSIFVYRGAHISRETIEEYKQAAGNHDKYFKWLSFVSTSFDRDVAERFGYNTLYTIELERYWSNDQFASLKANTYMESEDEVLLKPGVRFRVDKVKFDNDIGRNSVHLKIVPSYVSNLR